MTDCTDCDHLGESKCNIGKPTNHFYGRGIVSVASQHKRDTEVPCTSFKHTDRGISADSGELSRSASKKHRRALREIRRSELLPGK